MLRSSVIFYLLTLTIFGQIQKSDKTEVASLDLFIAYTKQPQNGKEVDLSGRTRKAFIDDKAFLNNITILVAAKIYPRDMITIKRGDPVIFLKLSESEEKKIREFHKSNLSTKFYLRYKHGEKEQYFETRFPSGPISTITINGNSNQIEELHKSLNQIKTNKQKK